MKEKKIDTLTQLVLQYKENPTPEVFEKIYYSKTVKKLTWQVLKNYGVLNFPPIIQEDIAEDCQSLVLLKCIERFDKTRGAGFGTLYTWWCMSHVRNKRNQWLRREPLLNAYSLNDRVYNGNEKINWEDHVTSFTSNMKHKIKKTIEDGTFGNMPALKEEFMVEREA